jgi:Uma2 family endonuclease
MELATRTAAGHDMGYPKPRAGFTVDEYLTLERACEERNEYLDGHIFAMAGESEAHGTISVNLVISLGTQLKGTPCRAFTKDTKVRSGPVGAMPLPGSRETTGLFSYPDVVVVCGEVAYHDSYRDVVLNPVAIVEVLSETTEAFDRGAKFTRYQTWNPTLHDYVLVSQDQPQIEHYSRQADDSWTYRRSIDLEGVVAISSIQCTLKLADVYDRIVFPT